MPYPSLTQEAEMADELEQAQALLERHGWKVERPPFDDPYEVMFRRLLYEAGGGDMEKYHPTDNPMAVEYEWTDWDRTAVEFLKKHFTLKTEAGDA